MIRERILLELSALLRKGAEILDANEAVLREQRMMCLFPQDTRVRLHVACVKAGNRMDSYEKLEAVGEWRVVCYDAVEDRYRLRRPMDWEPNKTAGVMLPTNGWYSYDKSETRAVPLCLSRAEYREVT